jgi:hypothetical protein
MLLSQLQTQLAGFYGAPVSYDVYDFLITDRSLAAALTPPGAQTDNQERLLLREDASELALSLYIDETVLSSLGEDDPTVFLHDGNLDGFLIALEGVSHLQYLIFRAERARPVSLLELELQAEVDKYVTSAGLVSTQGDGRVPRALHARLFDEVRFDATLPATELARYEEANRLAARYCDALRRRFPGHHREASFVRELRGFYRLGGREKIGHILALR